jgi:arylsulfatase A-like enzyme
MALRNVLFVMCDQLRHDYLGCAGHPHLATPNIDALAASGLRFTRAFVQSPVCGPSRMSFYTGRYVASHGATWNNVPLRVGEPTLGDHLHPHGLRVAVCGKTHAVPDRAGLARLGLDPGSGAGLLAAEAGFEPFARDDGLHPSVSTSGEGAYERFLHASGYEGPHPWERWANAVEGAEGEPLSGWHMRHARQPARIRAEDSETAWTTNQAIAFLEQAGDQPFLLHVSYIKPHWPYIAPAPFHALYGPNQVLPQVAHPAEREAPHPVQAAFMDLEESRTWSRREVRETVIPAYMGLIAEVDHHLGRLMEALRRTGRDGDTLVVFTSDHGDYLGDHWLGEKELFHDQSVRVPLILRDPRPAADATRGGACDALAEAIDLAPSFLDALGLPAQDHVLEGWSLMPLLHGTPPPGWRTAAVSELDYSFRLSRRALGLGPEDGRAWMLRTSRWKLVWHERFRPQLFDLEADPSEFHDLGAEPALEAVRQELAAALFARLRGLKRRITVSNAEVQARTGTGRQRGYLIGVW